MPCVLRQRIQVDRIKAWLCGIDIWHGVWDWVEGEWYVESGEWECKWVIIRLLYICELVWATLMFGSGSKMCTRDIGSGSGMLGPDRAICKNVMRVECKR